MQAFGHAPGDELVRSIPIELEIPINRLLSCLGSCDLPAVSYVPAVAQAFDLAAPDPSGRPSTLRFELVPESPDLRWWAVVSATDNATQEITLYQPAR